jgi:hypothetical protein
LHIIPVTLDQANAFVQRYHKHHRRLPCHKFSVGVADEDGRLVGVAIIGRPVARAQDDGLTLEVSRYCTDGTPNACSALYRAAWRVTAALGYKRLITYTLHSEPGTSLIAAGFNLTGVTRATGNNWNRPKRLGPNLHPLGPKKRWELAVGPDCDGRLTRPSASTP